MTEPADTSILNSIAAVVAEHGCQLVDVDLEARVINIEGPEDRKMDCALALEELLQ